MGCMMALYLQINPFYIIVFIVLGLFITVQVWSVTLTVGQLGNTDTCSSGIHNVYDMYSIFGYPI
jgi:hypothetical protein